MWRPISGAASNLAMSSPRPRPKPNPRPRPFHMPSNSQQSHSLHRWRHTFCDGSPSFQDPSHSRTPKDLGYRPEELIPPPQFQPRHIFPYVPPGPNCAVQYAQTGYYPVFYRPQPAAADGYYLPPSPVFPRSAAGGYYGPPSSGGPSGFFRNSPRPRPPDFRTWVFSQSQPPPPHCERFKVLSYNILAEYLARDHRSKLYFHIPRHILDWEWRKRRILLEFGLWSADIMCLQEVDRFPDLQEELAVRGYEGIWKVQS